MHFSLGFKWYLRQYETSAITNEIEKSKTAFNMFCGNIQNTMNHRLGHLHIECEFLKGSTIKEKCMLSNFTTMHPSYFRLEQGD